MHKFLLLSLALTTCGCAADAIEVHGTHGDAHLRVTPAVVEDTNMLELTGVASDSPALQAVATMDDMPSKRTTAFVRDGNRYVATTHFSMAGTWRIHVNLSQPTDFIVTLK